MGVGAIAAEVLQGSGKVEVIKNGQHAKFPPRGGEGGGADSEKCRPHLQYIHYAVYVRVYMYCIVWEQCGVWLYICTLTFYSAHTAHSVQVKERMTVYSVHQ